MVPLKNLTGDDAVVELEVAEAELLLKLANGDQEAFTLLYHKYSAQLYLNVLKLVKDEQVTEELIQDLFARVWQKKAELQIASSFSAYLFRMAQNMVHDFYRKLQRDQNLYNQFKQIATEHYSHIEEALHYKEHESLLHKAMDKLSPQQQNVYRMCKIEGLSYKATAEKLGISPHTVKEYLGKANQLIKEALLNNMEGTLGILLLLALK